MSRKTNLRIYKRPTLTLSCDTWSLIKAMEENVDIWERKKCSGGEYLEARKLMVFGKEKQPRNIRYISRSQNITGRELLKMF